ncbi:MAG TPA: GNAT family N-acetyltransferase [Terriglobales bacterium]|nr:GNAT family N-acetyltransferase [Terriglobales bacterium]
MKLLIRSAVRADVPAIMALEKHAATAAHWSLTQHLAVFDDASPNRLALVIEITEEDDARPALHGFLIARAVGADWELENIAISGSARRRGLGTRLLGEFLDQVRAQSATSVFLEVRESNLAARKLYEKWAFVETGCRPNYYQDPAEAAILYRLDFA